MKWTLLALLSCAILYGADNGAEPRLFFSKSFPGSTPAYVAITLERNGAGEYKESADDDSPLKLQLSAQETGEMFALADRLDHFTHPLESGLKVARMGEKTFRFEEGAKKTEVKFNYSENVDARELAEWFERISETAQNYFALERAVKYDKLGVNKALLDFGVAMEHFRVVSPAIFLPLLDRVAKNESFINMARLRAANMADAIRAAK